MSESKVDEKHDERSAPEGFAGYTLCDPVRREIGKVEQVFSGVGGEVQYVMVKIRVGFFWRRASVLIPVMDTVVDEKQRIITLG